MIIKINFLCYIKKKSIRVIFLFQYSSTSGSPAVSTAPFLLHHRFRLACFMNRHYFLLITKRSAVILLDPHFNQKTMIKVNLEMQLKFQFDFDCDSINRVLYTQKRLRSLKQIILQEGIRL